MKWNCYHEQRETLKVLQVNIYQDYNIKIHKLLSITPSAHCLNEYERVHWINNNVTFYHYGIYSKETNTNTECSESHFFCLTLFLKHSPIYYIYVQTTFNLLKKGLTSTLLWIAGFNITLCLVVLTSPKQCY